METSEVFGHGEFLARSGVKMNGFCIHKITSVMSKKDDEPELIHNIIAGIVVAVVVVPVMLMFFLASAALSLITALFWGVAGLLYWSGK